MRDWNGYPHQLFGMWACTRPERAHQIGSTASVWRGEAEHLADADERFDATDDAAQVLNRKFARVDSTE